MQHANAFQASELNPSMLDVMRGRVRTAETHNAPLSVAPPVASAFNTLLDVPVRDWDVLFCAVKYRLRLMAGAQLDTVPEINTTLAEVRSGVLECAAALDQLHTSLEHELGLRQQLEQELLRAKTALAQVRADLAGTQQEEQHARYLALHDSLTSLPNRNCFRARLDEALKHAQLKSHALAVMYLDLDGFKQINDDHGHNVGDELLKIVAARLTRALRVEDTVGRLGGDEFACLLAEFSERDHLCNLAEKLSNAVSAPMKIDQLTLSIRASFGIALCPADGSSVEALLKQADAAMYHAKRYQTGHAFFDQCIDT